MEPSFRDQHLRMIDRLQAETKIHMAQAMRAAFADGESYESAMSLWHQIAIGKQIDVDMDYRGRPMTEDISEFIGFATYKRAPLLKHGVIQHNEYVQ